MGQADGAEQVGGDRRLRHVEVDPVLRHHDAGIEQHRIEGREIRQQLLREGRDRRRVGHVQRHRRHAGMVRDHGIEGVAPPPGDDDLIAGLVKFMRQRRADARTAAGDEDGIACGLHGSLLSIGLTLM